MDESVCHLQDSSFQVSLVPEKALPVSAGMAIVAVFGLVHGNAHGLEAQVAGNDTLYVVGFLLSTVALHLLGLGFGVAARSPRTHKLICAGAAIVAISGGAFLFA